MSFERPFNFLQNDISLIGITPLVGELDFDKVKHVVDGDHDIEVVVPGHVVHSYQTFLEISNQTFISDRLPKI